MRGCPSALDRYAMPVGAAAAAAAAAAAVGVRGEALPRPPHPSPPLSFDVFASLVGNVAGVSGAALIAVRSLTSR